VSYLVDTNIISELRKRERADANVRTWFASVTDDDLFLSVLVIGEIRQGIERVRERDSRQVEALEAWLGRVRKLFGPRLLPITESVAQEWGRLNRTRPLPTVDSLLAATAKVNGLTLVSRNAADYSGTGVSFLDPFTA
jgi:predicted nucleic acid-binding protein